MAALSNSPLLLRATTTTIMMPDLPSSSTCQASSSCISLAESLLRSQLAGVIRVGMGGSSMRARRGSSSWVCTPSSKPTRYEATSTPKAHFDPRGSSQEQQGISSSSSVPFQSPSLLTSATSPHTAQLLSSSASLNPLFSPSFQGPSSTALPSSPSPSASPYPQVAPPPSLDPLLSRFPFLSLRLRVLDLHLHPLQVPLKEPFGIASVVVRNVQNIAVQAHVMVEAKGGGLGGGMGDVGGVGSGSGVSLQEERGSGGTAASDPLQGGLRGDGMVYGAGWGEVAVMPPVTAEDFPRAMLGLEAAAKFLSLRQAASVADHISALSGHLPGHAFAAVRAGVEMSLIDAVARALQLPLWRLFGGAGNTLVTDVTIPICPPSEAASLAAHYRQQQFNIIKTKVGTNSSINGSSSSGLSSPSSADDASMAGIEADVARVVAIRHHHPTSLLLLDANCGFPSASHALHFLQLLHDVGICPEVLEQPLAREDWDGLRLVSDEAKRKFNVLVAADESCRSVSDAQLIASQGMAPILNIKLAKLGVMGALQVVEIAQSTGLGLMIGGMVETRLAMGFAAHMAAGLGCFGHVDLDTPLLLAEDPVLGGYKVDGPNYHLGDSAGHGGELRDQSF